MVCYECRIGGLNSRFMIFLIFENIFESLVILKYEIKFLLFDIRMYYWLYFY